MKRRKQGNVDPIKKILDAAMTAADCVRASQADVITAGVELIVMGVEELCGDDDYDSPLIVALQREIGQAVMRYCRQRGKEVVFTFETA